MHKNSIAFYKVVIVREHSGYGKRIFSKSGSLERISFVLIPILASKMQFQRTTIEPGPPTSSPGLFPQKMGGSTHFLREKPWGRGCLGRPSD